MDVGRVTYPYFKIDYGAVWIVILVKMKKSPEGNAIEGILLFRLRLHVGIDRGFIVGGVRPSTEDGQDGKDYTTDDIAQNAHQKVANRFPRETKEVDVQGVCNRVVKTAEGKHDDGEHYANRRG